MSKIYGRKALKSDVAKRLRIKKEQLKEMTGINFRTFRQRRVHDPDYSAEDYLCGQIQALLTIQRDL